ncbi:MAG: transposase [Rhodospirillaceae bacterium]|nr:MAG: transposase [Rhodospirillaceae bacterium]
MVIAEKENKKITKTDLAKKLNISRGMLYYQHKIPLLDEDLKLQIEAAWVKHPAYGHKRLALELKLNKKRILRVMKKFGMKPYRRKVNKPKKKEDEGKEAVKDEINIYKFLCPIGLDIVWVSDFTYSCYAVT